MELVITLNQTELKLEIQHPALEKDGGLKFGRRPVLFKGGVDPERGREGTQRASASYGVDFETAKYYHDLSDVLISTLDKLLKRNKIDTTALKSFKINGNLGKDSTSYKITGAFLAALKTRS